MNNKMLPARLQQLANQLKQCQTDQDRLVLLDRDPEVQACPIQCEGLDPEAVVTPGIFVDRVVLSTSRDNHAG